jgi:hypothetical protein
VEDAGVQIFDIADPARPRAVGHIATSGEASIVAVASSGIVVAGDYGVDLAPVPCPGARTPTLLGGFAVEPTEEVVKIRWQIEDVGSIAALRLLARSGDEEWDVPFAGGPNGEYSAADDVALAAGGTTLYSLSARPSDGDWVVLASHTLTLPSSEIGSRLFQPSPNPARGAVEIRFASGKSQAIDLAVFSVDGRRLTTLANGKVAGRIGRVRWDGTNGRGASLPAGVYWVRLQAGPKVHTRKVLRLR